MCILSASCKNEVGGDAYREAKALLVIYFVMFLLRFPGKHCVAQIY